MAATGELIRLINKDLPDPARKAGLHITLELLIGLYRSGGLNSAEKVFFFDCSDLKAD